MDRAVAKNPTESRSADLRSVDPVWERIREAAQSAAAAEPVLAGTLHATILSQPRFESALSYHLARLVGTTEVPAALIRQTFDEAFAADPGIGLAARADIVAVTDRDPACTSHLDPLLWFKGYHALQTYRAKGHEVDGAIVKTGGLLRKGAAQRWCASVLRSPPLP